MLTLQKNTRSLLQTGILLWLAICSVWVSAMSADVCKESECSFAIYTLSRGKGVPDAARTLLQDSINLVEALRLKGHNIKITQQRLGLEGETRLCVKFSDAKLWVSTLKKIRTLAQGVELVNVVEEPCLSHQVP